MSSFPRIGENYLDPVQEAGICQTMEAAFFLAVEDGAITGGDEEGDVHDFMLFFVELM